ncbi:TrkH family potassium uptake protein [Candidatus Electrothrix sp.]|uniref:TrkH family potassium uptake protein n=1 Tax=Candidatus Electrothrix sp. TaxID=2170559 RepID=UPI004056FF0A
MHYLSIIHIIGLLLTATGSSMLLPLVCSLYYGESDFLAILIAILIALGTGLPCWLGIKNQKELNIRDGIIIAVAGWVIVSAASGLPFMIHGSIPSFTDAFFEMMSGYTTTGATILNDIEALPHGLLLWRSETHLLGGMGFLTLIILFLPKGMGGLRLFRAESSPGQSFTGEKFAARTKDTMVRLWAVYLGLNILQVILLAGGGMELFDALCTAFGTLSTSGYSPKNASIGFYDNAYFDWVIILFMFLGGTSFILLYHMAYGGIKEITRNTEFRWYTILTALFCCAVSLILWFQGTYSGIIDAARYGTFQAMSLLTTTGFGTADYEQWPQAAQMFLYVSCLIGGCAGSTASGIKIVHYVIICKFVWGTVRKSFFQPMSIVSVRLNGKQIDVSMINMAICYFIVNIFIIFIGGCFMTLVDDMDYVTAMSSVISALMTIGPGFGEIGPTENYYAISDIGKWFLAWNMMVGRLELFSALVVFYPSFWKK